MPLSRAAFGLGNDPEPEEETIEEEETEEETSTEDEESDPLLGDEPEDDEDPFSAPDDDEEKPGRKPAVERRIDKLVAERQEAREQALELRGKVEAYEEQVDGLRELNSTFDQLYGRFDDPSEQLRFDAALVGALEKETQSNADLARLLKPIIEKVGDNPVSDERTAPKTDETPAGPDPLMVRLAEREAASVIETALPEGVRPVFANLLKKEIFSALSPADLADLSQDDVISAARDFAKKSGFKRDDIYAAAAASDDETPPTAGRSRPATRGRTAKEAGDKKAAEAPKTAHEWRERNIRRLEDAFGGNE